MSVKGRRTIFNIDICEINDQASNMNNRLSKTFEKQLLSEFDKETIDSVNHFLNDIEKMYNTIKLMRYIEDPKKLDDDWNAEWGNKPDA